ncbi:MAG: alpha/beta fold hydrolase [Pseudomonadota bacterium]
MRRSFRNIVWLGLGLIAALLAVVRLEGARSGVEINPVQIAETPATIYRPAGEAPSDHLVVVSHGFAGSRQMMEAISLTLARSGLTVLAFDYVGHGRHPGRLSAEIERLDGTTEQLVAQTLDVIAAARDLEAHGKLSLLGHSMATDIVIRAGQRLGDVASIVAISMYSEAVTAEDPERLLIISGAGEPRLRAVALEAVALVEAADEGVTVENGAISRRAVAAPYVEHVGVLWSATTLEEASAWLAAGPAPVQTGPWLIALLGAILLMFHPLAQLLPERAKDTQPDVPSLKRAWAAALIPVPLVVAAAFVEVPLLGLAGFGGLTVALGVWGVSALLILQPFRPMRKTDLIAACLLLVWGLGVFGLALDRYGAAFVPVGPRLPLLLMILPGALAFALADRAMVQGRGVAGRVLLRGPFLASLLAAMVLVPTNLGLVFTVAPVLVLFHLVYGTMAGWAARRVGHMGPGLAAGVILAWSIAASTPLFSAA